VALQSGRAQAAVNTVPQPKLVQTRSWWVVCRLNTEPSSSEAGDLRHVNEPYTARVRGFVGKIYGPLFITYYDIKIKSEVGPPPCNRLAQRPPPSDTRVTIALVARPWLTPYAQKLCRCERRVFTNGKSVHSRILIHPAGTVLRQCFFNAAVRLTCQQ
jgi:hypothetical protein